ncbi:MAG: hypothetical protein ACRC0V_05210 [Fusobacteriaceae bacterium]
MREEVKFLTKELKTTKDNYYKHHFSIINTFLPKQTSRKEIEIIANFLSLDTSITEENMFNTISRNKVKEKMAISDGGLSNHLKSLKSKGIIVRNKETGFLEISKFLLPAEKEQNYNIRLITE